MGQITIGRRQIQGESEMLFLSAMLCYYVISFGMRTTSKASKKVGLPYTLMNCTISNTLYTNTVLFFKKIYDRLESLTKSELVDL